MENDRIRIKKSDIKVLDFILDKMVSNGRIDEVDLVENGYIEKDIPQLEKRRRYLYYVPILNEYCGVSHGVENGYTVDLDTRTINFYRNGGFEGAYKRQIKKSICSITTTFVPIIISIIAISISMYQCNYSNNNELEIYKTNNKIDSVSTKVKGIEYFIDAGRDSMQSKWSQEKQSP